MNAAAPITTTTLDRPRRSTPDAGNASSGQFEQLWTALREAPTRKRAEPAPDPNTAKTVMVSAASMNTALGKVATDRVTDALTAFKRESWLTFTHSATASAYSAELAPRGSPARTEFRYPFHGPVGGPSAKRTE